MSIDALIAGPAICSCSNKPDFVLDRWHQVNWPFPALVRWEIPERLMNALPIVRDLNLAEHILSRGRKPFIYQFRFPGTYEQCWKFNEPKAKRPLGSPDQKPQERLASAQTVKACEDFAMSRGVPVGGAAEV